eukprot:gnl/TRDRNA2_/TRDRNA2_87424_c0_seq1.p1 gnl/TRDRNA2_/TRDRNA2_87424_c0~~gnl/TRDRNA2_/TRDRNA2_87424_c0_seq1.p1  ORF type:complete len:360 (+),score=51.07 gnl/TRDRNA2_/TRDRNA2_87424_c0_seq1:110-1189(+)
MIGSVHLAGDGLMRTASVLLTFAFVSHAQAKQQAFAGWPAHGPFEGLVDTLADRASAGWSLHGINLENTTVGKGVSSIAVQRTPLAVIRPPKTISFGQAPHMAKPRSSMKLGATSTQDGAQSKLIYMHGVSPEGASHPRLDKVRGALGDKVILAPDITGGGPSYEKCTISGALKVLDAACGSDGPVSIIASSFGAFVSLLFAARHPERVSSLFLLGPALNMKANLKLFKIDEEVQAEWQRDGVRELGGIRLGWPWVEEILALDEGDCPPQPLCPVTLVMPEADLDRARGFLDGKPAAAPPRRVLVTRGWSPYEQDKGIETALPHLTHWADGTPSTDDATAVPLEVLESTAGFKVEVIPE